MMMKSDFGPEERRLAEKIEKVVTLNGGPAAVSRASLVPESSLKKYMKGLISPSAVALLKIAEATNVSVDWLVGRGGTLSGSSEFGIDDPNKADTYHIAILDVVAGAGSGIDNVEPELIGELPFSREKLRSLGIKPEKVRAHELRGDSMEPTIMDRACVLVDTAKRDLVDGRIYSLRAPEGLRVKRIQRQMDGSVLLISDNRDRYQPERLSAEEAERISVLGRVFWADKLL
jgi:phage repressor protein C with HTH and peptisase S24 domain